MRLAYYQLGDRIKALDSLTIESERHCFEKINLGKLFSLKYINSYNRAFHINHTSEKIYSFVNLIPPFPFLLEE